MKCLGVCNSLWSLFLFLTNTEKQIQKEGVQSGALYWFKMPVRYPSGAYTHSWSWMSPVQERGLRWIKKKKIGNINMLMLFRAQAGCNNLGSVASEGRQLSWGSWCILCTLTTLLSRRASLGTQGSSPVWREARVFPRTVTSVPGGQLPTTSQTVVLLPWETLLQRSLPGPAVWCSLHSFPAFAPEYGGL